MHDQTFICDNPKYSISRECDVRERGYLIKRDTVDRLQLKMLMLRDCTREDTKL